MPSFPPNFQSPCPLEWQPHSYHPGPPSAAFSWCDVCTLHLPASAGLSRPSPHSMSAVSALPTAASHTPGPSLTLPRRGPGAPSHWLGIVNPLQPALYLKGTRLSSLWFEDEYLRPPQSQGHMAAPRLLEEGDPGSSHSVLGTGFCS